MSELHDVDGRLAVLEQIAADTATTLAEFRTELRETRGELHAEMAALRTASRSRTPSARGVSESLCKASRILLF